MKEIKVELTHEESNWIERLWYEYNASLNILRFLMSQDTVLEKHLQKYLDSSEAKYAELEMAKSGLTKQHKPEAIGDSFDYRFDFDEHTVIYQERSDEKEKN